MSQRTRKSRGPWRAWLLGAALIGWLFGTDPAPANITLTVDTNSVSIPIQITDYNTVTGAATVTVTTAQTLAVHSTNKNWTLSVRALSSTFSFTPSLGDANPNKPASDLAARAPTESNVFITLTTSNQVIGGGAKSTVNVNVPIDYRILSNLATDPPGTYSLSIIYTVVET